MLLVLVPVGALGLARDWETVFAQPYAVADVADAVGPAVVFIKAEFQAVAQRSSPFMDPM